jgi:acetyl-CoA carboxylase carboxyltransferase component
MDLRALTDDLAARKATIRLGGGEAETAKQHRLGKLTARERLDLLCDPGSFEEFGILVHHTNASAEMRGKVTPADGVVCGFARVSGRPVAIIAYDFTVMAGSMGANGELKVARMREAALARLIPLIWLLDSAGARIQELAGSQFAGSGSLFKDQVTMSGAIPQIAAVMGPTAAGTSYIAALADFVPIVANIGTMALAGPALVRAAVGEVVDINELGGSKVHTQKSGVAHLECPDDRGCLDAIRAYLSFMPLNYRDPLPVPNPWIAGTGAGTDLKRSDEIFQILPDSQRKGYDMRRLIRWLADEGSILELQPEWARNIITGFARIGGIGLGVVANQPSMMGGAIDLDAADKAARFINLCDAYGIPLLFLHDCPGFWVGSKMEHAGIIRHGAKMLFAVSRLTVPKISVVVRKSYGAGYYVMCGKGYDPDLIVGWPGSEISLMSPEGAVNIICKDEAGKAQATEEYRRLIGAELSARQALIDDVIDPRDTARVVAAQLAVLLPQHNVERQRLAGKKHGVTPV